MPAAHNQEAQGRSARPLLIEAGMGESARNGPQRLRAPSMTRQPASWRDSAGCVYSVDGVFYRQVNRSFAEEFDAIHDSGLYDELVTAGLLISHEFVERPVFDEATAHRILRPEQLGFISYPYEWCFGQLQDAALATLAIQRKALDHGMTLRDASAYNLQPRRDGWTLIDTLSFERYQDGRPWGAYRQFCQHFLAPLALAAHVDPAMLGLLMCHIDGIDLSLASRALPWRTRLRLGLGLHIHAHARSLKRHASAPSPSSSSPSRWRLSLKRQLQIIDHLEGTIRGLRLPKRQTTWNGYYAGMHNYTDEAFETKQAIVRDFLRTLSPRVVWDLGANDGTFSRIAAEQGAETIAWDSDHGCVQACYEYNKRIGESNVLPLLLDVTNPSPAIGWANEERQSLMERAERRPADVVLMLGLVHHLAIGNNVPWEHISRFAAQLGKTLIVEFVAKDDSQVQRLLSAREDIFDNYTRERFESAFSREFVISGGVDIPATNRTVFLFKRK